MMDEILAKLLLDHTLNGMGKMSKNGWESETLSMVARELNQRLNLSVGDDNCFDADRQAWDAYFRAHPVARHLRGRMFPYFAEACAIFGNDYSYHTLNVCESFGPVVAETPQVVSVLGERFGDTQVESVESVSGLGEPSSVVDTTPSPPSVEYSFP
ncbi:hypothetical protein IFM89_001879 [Coptis chinensis]|uniref:Uncharacterized protein n=1 Tax=Coptis chinensis TaxID=261450 RepID=A0A835IMU4_9MAGN|nr:hypothetical protein IFM89_001879 [Coptis chinensis]